MSPGCWTTWASPTHIWLGHDWGAPIGYLLATSDRKRVRSYAAIEANFPGAGGENLMNFAKAWNPLWFFPFLATPEISPTADHRTRGGVLRWGAAPDEPLAP